MRLFPMRRKKNERREKMSKKIKICFAASSGGHLEEITRLIYPFADLLIVQWEEGLKFFPKAVYGGGIF